MKNLMLAITTLVLLVVINVFFWTVFNQPKNSQSWDGTMMGVSFTPLRADHDPDKGLFPTREEISQDLELIADKVHAVRTYSVSNGMEAIPELAAEYGLNVTIGAWISKDKEANQQEIERLIALSRKNNRNIVRTLVGNEVILRKDLTVPELMDYIRLVKKRTWRPVSTAETWDIWLKHPELAKEVDFIAVHILPYWEGIAAGQAIKYVFDRYHTLQAAFPDKPVVITEVGWPSNGKAIKNAKASLTLQATFLREFLYIAQKEKLIYYVVEAFDQPWKIDKEGSSGAYWGIYDAQRQAKFPMQGEILNFPDWKHWAAVATVLSFLLMMIFLITRHRMKMPGKLFLVLVTNLGATTIVWTTSIGVNQYQTSFSAILWVILLAMQAMALLVLLIESLELAEILWTKDRKRNFKPLSVPEDYAFPKVSLHVPIHNEPPEMVKETLEALAKLDYPELEVLVIDNNTTDPTVWKPVEADCKRLGERFRFFHLENWPGYKAGALNYALQQTANDAEIIAVIDSDYIVKPDWLKCMVPYFEKSDVGFVQSPQNYYDWQENGFKTICQWEYAGFFHIGMVQRNEYNAIIQHGTMTMIRKSALKEVGNWGEWCICEDSELGLRLYQAGYDSVYVKDTFGKGVTPDTLSGYLNQRHRWVYGGMQILKRHWRSLLNMKLATLTPAQRYYFIAGWLPWISDALALLFTITSLLLTASILVDPVRGEIPISVFILPTIGLFGFKILRSFWLYRARVKCTLLQTIGAAIAGLALTHTVGVAVLQGLFTSGRPFLRTPKCEGDKPILAGLLTIYQEIIILALLWTAAALFSSIELYDNLEGRLWTSVLLVQSMPYFASVLVFLINIASNIQSALVGAKKMPMIEQKKI
jgi:exo-beta-1,3-glucanase (GH17 family)/cellulose synthase/poly-beta-1,6-N-acetylglucosamine synthase-like glycosyltransferase